jgi:hypothetical protein
MVMGVIFLGFAALALLVGIGGSYVMARNLSGVSAFAAMLLWLVVPFFVLFGLFSSSADPTLPAERARANVVVAFMITSIVIAIPWIVANVIGWVLGRRRPKAAPLAAPVAPAPAQPRPETEPV